MMWMQSQLTRADMAGQEWGLNQKISLEEALICGTRNGAYASFEEAAKGMLRPGYAADLVVLERDLFTTDPHDFLNIGVQRTMVGGVWRFEA
jgi:predicted amidohydrolase YtcJ